MESEFKKINELYNHIVYLNGERNYPINEKTL